MTYSARSRVLLACLIAAGLYTGLPVSAAPLPAPTSKTVVNKAFDIWSDQFTEQWMELNPEFSTVAQYFEGARQTAADGRVFAIDQASLDQRTAIAKSGLVRLERFLAGPLSEEQRVSAQILRFGLQQTIAAAPFEDHSFMFQQMSGIHVIYVQVLNLWHPLRRPSDVDSYLLRLGQVGKLMDDGVKRARTAAGRKLIPPRYIIERTEAQIDKFLATTPDQNALMVSFAKRLDVIEGMTPETRAAALRTATVIVQRDVLPAYGRIQAFLAEIKPVAPEEGGLSTFPQGGDAYRQALFSNLGKLLSPDAIHAVGLSEVARIEGLMDRHLRTLGFEKGSINERMAALNVSLQPPTAPDPRAGLLQRYDDIVRDGIVRSKPLFLRAPLAKVEVRREPALTEPTAAASYTLGARDGSRPGVFWMPLPGPTYKMPQMRSLAYHEAVPGHHFQLGIQNELTDLPKFRINRVFDSGSAYVEGWALYAERLAVENNWYAGDIPGLLGALDSELFRARRLVVDTGLHAKGWTRQQAIDYGIPPHEVERYMVWPGQACSYMIGLLHILELRQNAKRTLGSKFSLPEFHDVVLRSGAVPLTVLTQIVERWTVTQQRSKRVR